MGKPSNHEAGGMSAHPKLPTQRPPRKEGAKETYTRYEEAHQRLSPPRARENAANGGDETGTTCTLLINPILRNAVLHQALPAGDER